MEIARDAGPRLSSVPAEAVDDERLRNPRDVVVWFESQHGWRKRERPLACLQHEDLIKRDKINLDIFWLKDEALEDSANVPAPGIIAAEILEDLEAALQQFATIANDLKK